MRNCAGAGAFKVEGEDVLIVIEMSGGATRDVWGRPDTFGPLRLSVGNASGRARLQSCRKVTPPSSALAAGGILPSRLHRLFLPRQPPHSRKQPWHRTPQH